MRKRLYYEHTPQRTQPLCRSRSGGYGEGGGGFDDGAAPLTQEDDPPPLDLIPDPLGALQP